MAQAQHSDSLTNGTPKFHRQRHTQIPVPTAQPDSSANGTSCISLGRKSQVIRVRQSESQSDDMISRNASQELTEQRVARVGTDAMVSPAG